MATSSSDQRRRTSSNTTSRRASGRTSSSGNRKPLQSRDTGYRVRSNGSLQSGRRQQQRGINPRLVIAGIIAVLLLIALVFGISSCVRGCSKPAQTQEDVAVNEQDSRVAAGVSSEETSRLSAVLDRNKAFSRIAKNADKISDTRLIDLAIAEPEAVEFVAGTLKADGTTEAYADATPQGEYPVLYTFDTRWGYMKYADGILGVTGSGPVALSIASMGLSGKSTYDPATVAQAVAAANLDSGTTGMDDAFVSSHADAAGLVATSVEASSDGIYNPLAEGQPVLVKIKSGSEVGSTDAHWALICGLNSNNSISLVDPTSAIASSHSWSLGAVSAATDTAFALTAGSGTTSSDDSAATSDDATAADDAAGTSTTTTDADSEA